MENNIQMFTLTLFIGNILVAHLNKRSEVVLPPKTTNEKNSAEYRKTKQNTAKHDILNSMYGIPAGRSFEMKILL